MVKVVTTEQMRAIDNEAINGNINIGFEYMKKASTALSVELRGLAGPPPGRGIAIVCGKGNNGGDGYLLGKILCNMNYNVQCFSLFTADSLFGEARQAFDEYVDCGGEIIQVSSESDLDKLNQFGLIVDAILGTGIKGELRGIVAKAVYIINAMNKKVISADTPSGINNDSGEMGDSAVKALSTVTMGFPKLGQFFYPGRDNIGQLIVADLEYPDDIVDKHFKNIWTLEREDIKTLLPARIPTGSKFDSGLTFMICGSEGMTGSAILAGESALRSGCGMVHLASPKSIISTLSLGVPEVVMHGVSETEDGTVAEASLNEVLELSERMHSVLIGPGISHNSSTVNFVQKFISKTALPVVLDADGINAFKNKIELLKNRNCELVITPHIGEWNRIFGELPDTPQELIETLSQKAKEYSMVILLKGNPTIVADLKGNVTIIALGNTALATAGSGDVLAGIIAGFAGQGLPLGESTVLGAAIHGLAGESCASKFGEHSTIASDLLKEIPQIIKSFAEDPRTGILL